MFNSLENTEKVLKNIHFYSQVLIKVKVAIQKHENDEKNIMKCHFMIISNGK